MKISKLENGGKIQKIKYRKKKIENTDRKRIEKKIEKYIKKKIEKY